MPDEFAFGGEFVWHPTPEIVAAAQVSRFMRQHGLANYDALMARSTGDIAWFTDAILKFLDIRFARPYRQVVDLSRGPAWPRWCVDGQLNITTNCLDKYQDDPALAARPALLWEAEDGQAGSLSYAELYRQTNQCANLLRALGLGKGDAVGLYMPMAPEIVVALLAVARIGGLALPLFSGYGTSAVATRLTDGHAKALITADGFVRRGQVVPLKPVADKACAGTSAVEHMLVLRQAGNPVDMQAGRDLWWHEHVPAQANSAAPEPTSAEDTLMILYTSGTTGRPKGAVHTHCGFTVKAAQDMALGLDVHAGERVYWMTDMGWMMGPWLVFGTLLLGASMFIYDGAPDWGAPSAPGQVAGFDPGRLWALIERHQLTHLGLSPTLVRALSQYGAEPVRRHSLASLRILASTGEPWNPAPWQWLFETVGGGRLPIINYSGGTEIGGGIVMGSPILPLKSCAFSAACPGMAADVVDEAGQPVRNQVGELVIRAPWIGMTRGFWQDPQRYEETYWSRFPGLWVHGDFAAIDQDGMWYILGRSDDTIKVAGKRLGPAEVESLLVGDPAVVEAAAIGVPDEIKGSSVVCFCVLRAGVAPDEALRQALMARVAAGLGKPLRPREIRFVKDLPKTRNAKVMRRLIRSAYLGQPLGDVTSLENPAAVEAIRRAE
jgi:acetyl-CoA synthetase